MFHSGGRTEVILRRDQQPRIRHLCRPRLRHLVTGSLCQSIGLYLSIALAICIVPDSFIGSAGAQELQARVSAQVGGTEVPIASALTSLLSSGGVPKSIDALRQLEAQQRRVANAAVACTVSVQIGPAQGCGVIITESGFILTAAHVAMRPGRKALISLSNGRTVRATTLGMNRNVDAGLIKIDPNQNDGQPWPHATLGESDNLVPGMWCVATGHPGGYDANRGPVTRIGRILDVQRTSIVTDCALIGGDSGGPLFDIAGRLIAVHSRIGNDVAENLHVPIDHYGTSWDRMLNSVAWGFLPGFRPVLGVTGSSSSAIAQIGEVSPGSPAERAGLKSDDVITQFGEVKIADFESLKAAVADTMPGERLRIIVRRDGIMKGFDIEVGRAD
jgi:S1-C subfamily serine protease